MLETFKFFDSPKKESSEKSDKICASPGSRTQATMNGVIVRRRNNTSKARRIAEWKESLAKYRVVKRSLFTCGDSKNGLMGNILGKI